MSRNDKMKQNGADVKEKTAGSDYGAADETAKADNSASSVNEENINSDCKDNQDTSETVDMNEAQESTSDTPSGSDRKESRDQKMEELQDKVKRQMAEFDNFRKRTEKEKAAMFEMGASDIIKKLLPIVDNFERGFKSISEDELQTPFAKGMDMVYKQMVKMLDESEVKAIESVGSEFNPDLHNAVMHVEDDSVGEGIVVEEFEKGYTYRETVIRHSMVKVAN